MNVVALAMRQHQVGAFALANHPAILKIKRLRRIFSHQLHRLRQRKAVALVIGDANAASSRLAG